MIIQEKTVVQEFDADFGGIKKMMEATFGQYDHPIAAFVKWKMAYDDQVDSYAWGTSDHPHRFHSFCERVDAEVELARSIIKYVNAIRKERDITGKEAKS